MVRSMLILTSAATCHQGTDAAPAGAALAWSQPWGCWAAWGSFCSQEPWGRAPPGSPTLMCWGSVSASVPSNTPGSLVRVTHQPCCFMVSAPERAMYHRISLHINQAWGEAAPCAWAVARCKVPGASPCCPLAGTGSYMAHACCPQSAQLHASKPWGCVCSAVPAPSPHTVCPDTVKPRVHGSHVCHCTASKSRTKRSAQL